MAARSGAVCSARACGAVSACSTLGVLALAGTDRFSLAGLPHAPLHAGKIEEIGQQLMAVLRRNALGMELHPMHGIALVLQSHDHSLSGLRRDLEILW